MSHTLLPTVERNPTGTSLVAERTWHSSQGQTCHTRVLGQSQAYEQPNLDFASITSEWRV
nr:hypothetical protein [Rubripirellula sp.]